MVLLLLVFSELIIDRTGGQTMLYLTCTMIASVNIRGYLVLKMWVSGKCATKQFNVIYSCNIYNETAILNFAKFR